MRYFLRELCDLMVRYYLFKFLKLFLTADCTDFSDLGCAVPVLLRRFYLDFADFATHGKNPCNPSLCDKIPIE